MSPSLNGLRRLWPRRLGGRAILVLLTAVVMVHLGSVLIHQEETTEVVDAVLAGQLAGRLVTAARALGALEPAQRDAGAHAISSDAMSLHWEAIPAVQAGAESAELRTLHQRALEASATLGQLQLRLAYPEGAATGSRQAVIGTLTLSDGSYLNFSAHAVAPTFSSGHATLISTSLMAAGVGGLAVLLMLALVAPLRRLAVAVDAIGRGPVVDVPETGPDEIQHVARAFNAMQARIHKLIADRTLALASVSHDLRTPITRMRLRAGFLADAEGQQAIDADLDEMEGMIEATLQFLRGGVEAEEPRRTDLASLLSTLVNNAADAGHEATYDGPHHLPFCTRVLSIKRAVTNLIGNATAHGGCARVSLAREPGGVRIQVADRGPGIPEHAMKRVFEPFERLENSRNRGSGGTGLGLSIAKQAIDREGGTIQLRNLPEGGLSVEVFLPERSESAAASLA